LDAHDQIQRQRAALERIRRVAKESREAKYYVYNHLLIEMVAEQALSTTTEPINAEKVERVREGDGNDV